MVKAPPQLFVLCRSAFFELKYGADTLEDAFELAVNKASPATRSAVKAYLTHVAEGEIDIEDLTRTWSQAASEAGWIFEGDARAAALALRLPLAKVRHVKRHG